MIDSRSVQAAILDLDGVVTETARLHARAWRDMFDAVLDERGEREGEDQSPFGVDDYDQYVDGKPRYDGVRSFLEARGIDLPEGAPDDPPDAVTIHGLGNRKNERFHELLEQHGVEVYDDAIEQIRRWRTRGLGVAVVSSSKNCKTILERAGLLDLFDARVDGVVAERLGLDGKPAPDIFLEAADRLGVEPERAAVFEDARAGVEAGRAGGFGLVVGVSRNGNDEALRAHGADVVVHDLREVEDRIQEHRASDGQSSARG
ncbi:MAG: beta-phosphoglucomutase family hydrolase [Salinivenus sp.]